MVQDSAGFQSQQFGEQVAQRRDRYAAQNIETWGQAANVVPRFQQAQQMVDERQMRAAKVASDLASDQLHRQQALEDLQWSQQLHQADMIGLQKRGMAAEIALKEAQTKHAIESLGEGRLNRYWELDEDQRDSLIADQGFIGVPNGNRVDVTKASEDQRAAARERQKARQEQRMREIQAGRYRTPPSDALETSRDVGVTGKRLEQLKEEIGALEQALRSKRTNPEDVPAIEAELQRLRSTARQLGDKMDQALLGDERPSSAQPEQTGADFIRSSVRGFLNDLDGDK